MILDEFPVALRADLMNVDTPQNWYTFLYLENAELWSLISDHSDPDVVRGYHHRRRSGFGRCASSFPLPPIVPIHNL